MKTVVDSQPEILGGATVFIGSRVFVQNLFDYPEASDRIDDFIDDSSTESREHDIAVLENARGALVDGAGSSR